MRCDPHDEISAFFEDYHRCHAPPEKVVVWHGNCNSMAGAHLGHRGGGGAGGRRRHGRGAKGLLRGGGNASAGATDDDITALLLPGERGARPTDWRDPAQWWAEADPNPTYK